MRVKVTYREVVDTIVEIDVPDHGDDMETVGEALDSAIAKGNTLVKELVVSDREVQSFIVLKRDEIKSAPKYEPEF